MNRCSKAGVRQWSVLVLGLATTALACGSQDTVPATTGGSGGAGGGDGAGAGGGALSCSTQVDTSLAYRASETPYGVAHSEWAERYFRWWASRPKSTAPSLGGDCAQDQQDPDAWFLPNDPGSVTELPSCSVPGDLGLLVDAHFEAVYTQPEPPANDCECRNPDGTDDANCLKQWQDDNFDLDDWEVCVEVDGAAVAAQEDMHDYLVWGGPSGYTLDPTEPKSIPPATIGPNPCGYDRFSQYPVVPEGIPRQMVFRGWLVMLKPLPSGAHKLRYYVIPSAPDQELGYEPMGVTMDLVVP